MKFLNLRTILQLIFFSFCSVLFKVHANNEIYVIVDSDLENVIIGKQKKCIGDVFSSNDSIEWPHIANCRIYVVKMDVIMKRKPLKEDIEVMSNMKVPENGHPAYEYFILGHRGSVDASNVFFLGKKEKVLIPAKHLPQKDMKPEIVWKKGDNRFMNSIRRTSDDKNYELSYDTFVDVPDNNILSVTIRETSLFDKRIIENVYQDLIIVFLP